jgi:hypothetical protein
VAVLEDILAMEGDEAINDYFRYHKGGDLLRGKHSVENL